MSRRAVQVAVRIALVVEFIALVGVMVIGGSQTDVMRTVALVLLVEVPLCLAIVVTVGLLS